MMARHVPLPLREREGPKPQAWEGEGMKYETSLREFAFASLPHPPTASRRAPPSPEMGEG